jgi:hypothetical protein
MTSIFYATIFTGLAALLFTGTEAQVDRLVKVHPRFLMEYTDSLVCFFIGACFGPFILIKRLGYSKLDLSIEAGFPLMLWGVHSTRFLIEKMRLNEMIFQSEYQLRIAIFVICLWFQVFPSDNLYHHVLLAWSFIESARCGINWAFLQGYNVPVETTNYIIHTYVVCMFMPVLIYACTVRQPEIWPFVYTVAVGLSKSYVESKLVKETPFKPLKEPLHTLLPPPVSGLIGDMNDID